MAKASWLDNVIGVFSPSSRFKRIQYKNASDTYEKEHKSLKRKYEGADVGRRAYGWRTMGTSANAEIKKAIRYKRPFTVLMLDADDLKAVNDQFGHAVGDKLIITIAQVVQEVPSVLIGLSEGVASLKGLNGVAARDM